MNDTQGLDLSGSGPNDFHRVASIIRIIEDDNA